MSESNTQKLAVIRFIFENFGKHFTYKNLLTEVPELSREFAYEVLAELEDTGHVLRDVKVSATSGKKSFVWGVDDSDEIHALELWVKYLRGTL